MCTFLNILEIFIKAAKKKQFTNAPGFLLAVLNSYIIYHLGDWDNLVTGWRTMTLYKCYARVIGYNFS